jgi:hypothetical protein
MMNLTRYRFEVVGRAASLERFDPEEAAKSFIETMDKKFEGAGFSCDVELDGEGTVSDPYEIGVSHTVVLVSLKVWSTDKDVIARLELGTNDSSVFDLNSEAGLDVKLKPASAEKMFKEFLSKSKVDEEIEKMREEIEGKQTLIDEAKKIISFFKA